MMRIVRSGRKVLVPTRRQRQLEKLRQDLLKSRALLARTLQWTPNLSDETLPADPADVAASEQGQRCDHILKDRASVKLRQIERALHRLNEASFGTCLGCREDISIERLKVQPEAIYCVECKDRHESSIRLRGGVVLA